ncbi:MAG: cob(I)yrinic acid a,c-diamide adenosyltransferase [Planctomycetota bacterium]
MKIYTKTGDTGQTGLPGGLRVSKDHLIINAVGSVDELNSILGLVRAGGLDDDVEKLLASVQNDLFDLGARVAMCLAPSDRTPVLSPERAGELEKAIDVWQDELPALTSFILPDGSEQSCRLQFARAVCRRAERQVVTLRSGVPESDGGGGASTISLDGELIYLNRLSDLLFVAARLVNRRLGQAETLWQPAKP